MKCPTCDTMLCGPWTNMLWFHPESECLWSGCTLSKIAWESLPVLSSTTGLGFGRLYLPIPTTKCRSHGAMPRWKVYSGADGYYVFQLHCAKDLCFTKQSDVIQTVINYWDEEMARLPDICVACNHLAESKIFGKPVCVGHKIAVMDALLRKVEATNCHYTGEEMKRDAFKILGVTA